MGVKVVIGNIVSVMAVVTGVDGGDHHHDLTFTTLRWWW